MCACSVTKSCLTLCNPVDCSSPGFSALGIFPRQEYWSGLPFPPPGDLSNPGMEPMSFALAGRFFTIKPLGKLQTTITRMQWLSGNLLPWDICVSLLFYISVSN